MDTLLLKRFLRRLTFFCVGVFVAVAASFIVVPVAHAESFVADYNTAMSDCNAFESSTPAPGGGAWIPCYVQYSTYQSLYEVYADWPTLGSHSSGWIIQNSGTVPSSNPCSSLTNTVEWVPGKILSGYQTDQQTPDAFTGANVDCRVTLVPATPPMSSGSGSWSTLVEVNPVASGVDTSPVAAPGKVVDSSGGATDVPSLPAAASANANTPAPQMCGGGSCYDPNTGNACAVGAAGQVCVNVQGSAGAAQPNCFSDVSSTICGGSPTAPSPVGQSGSSITDPPSQIQSSDQYTSANPTTGAVTGTTVNVYSSGGATSSGAGSGSVSTSKGSTSTVNGQSGPASSSSSGGNGDSFGGGGDCNTPPVCQGDAVMCGVAQEAWHTSCNVTIQTTALAGSNPTQQPPTFSSDSTKYGQSDVWQQSSGSGSTVGDSANQGTYDETGFGYATACPMTDTTVNIGSFGSFVIPFSQGCVIGPWIYWLVIGFSLYRAARITAGSAI